MGDDASQLHGRHGPAPRHRRAAGSASSTLTPPTGIPPVPDDPRPAAPVPPAPVAPELAVGLCVCLHDRAAHEHYRRGSDCGVCGVVRCATYRRRGGPLRRFLRRVGLVR